VKRQKDSKKTQIGTGAWNMGLLFIGGPGPLPISRGLWNVKLPLEKIEKKPNGLLKNWFGGLGGVSGPKNIGSFSRGGAGGIGDGNNRAGPTFQKKKKTNSLR